MTRRTARKRSRVSNNDSFIDEVSDEVRRDRLYAMLRRYGWIAILAVVLLVGAAAWVEWRRSAEQAEARAFGDAIVAALDAETPEARREALLAIDAEGTQQALLAMLAADTLETDEAEAQTLELLTEISGDGTIPPLYRELATLKAAMLLQDRADPQEVIDMIEPLTIPGAPYRLLALEQRAIAEMRAGETSDAIETLRGILEDGAATRDLQARARQLIVALGGSLETAEG
ncbi:hypothetical protein SAMN04488020_108139 [Palleronia marisminoris]|uniref:Tetratricopeptide repeat-like domain-containing protein n=1 Tax=Palleronia marisminoris TaxID=315423 RepID=A0A1Y5T8Z5_9RHOB|nr:hypothetical protein SAMN04488020_108139 [Palleronia marisminoris]SLN58437.1 hypothetical protein PAM7066_02847 [Palleronia marisminoris]